MLRSWSDQCAEVFRRTDPTFHVEKKTSRYWIGILLLLRETSPNRDKKTLGWGAFLFLFALKKLGKKNQTNRSPVVKTPLRCHGCSGVRRAGAALGAAGACDAGAFAVSPWAMECARIQRCLGQWGGGGFGRGLLIVVICGALKPTQKVTKLGNPGRFHGCFSVFGI